MKYEYIRLSFDFGDLAELNGLGSAGWRVVAVEKDAMGAHRHFALLERPLPTEKK